MVAGILLIGMMSQVAVPAGQVVESDPTIIEVNIRGNKLLNRESIASASGLKAGMPLTKDALAQAARNLISTGNFGCHHPDDPSRAVVITSDVDATANTARVTIDVDENDVVKGFNITGVGPIKPQEVLAAIHTKLGAILNLNTLRSDVAGLRQLCAGKGYQAAVSSEGFRITNGILDIPVVVGKFGGYRLPPLPAGLADEIRRVTQLKPGAYFHWPTIEADLKRIAAVCGRHGYLLENDLRKGIVVDGGGTPAPETFTRPRDIQLRIRHKPAGRHGYDIGHVW